MPPANQTMLHQSRWAPSEQERRGSPSMKSKPDIEKLREASGSESTQPAQWEDFSGWSDPALRMIDEESNKMDIDSQAVTGSDGGSSPFTQVSLVIDTNILLSHLEVLQHFAEDVERAQMPIMIAIPGVVVEELDYQKTDRSRRLCWSARMASTWILSKLKERRSVRGQAYHETLQASGSWKRRDPHTSNDDLIVDYCLFLREKRHHNVLTISQDTNFCATAESQDISTLKPKTFIQWSSRTLAQYLFGGDYPGLNAFANYRETFRPKRVREALNDELGVHTVKREEDKQEDGMEIDDESFSTMEPPPQHLLDYLHDQVLEHFGLLLSELLRRVAPPSLFTEAPSRTGAASSMYASPTSFKAAKDWKANEILHYLCNARRMPRTAPAADVKELTTNSSRMIDFFTHKYDTKGRSGQHWARADWSWCLSRLEVLARVYKDDAIINSLEQLRPQIELIFQMPMRPTGSGAC